ncbi:hypothetical protein Y032_0963g3229 [Ancylostoma ceylanicum]|uniref:Uncharacterized protein n=1 Tax=Ancylostoma ceylanicum TaxID=53326 RepID=A0A016W8D7_9BILA|nr:hypothetical protein Y032_0963g3229 [Ancylostoma ceylanicum]
MPTTRIIPARHLYLCPISLFAIQSHNLIDSFLCSSADSFAYNRCSNYVCFYSEIRDDKHSRICLATHSKMEGRHLHDEQLLHS